MSRYADILENTSPAAPPPFSALLDGAKLVAFIAASPENGVSHITRGLANEMNAVSPGRVIAIDGIDGVDYLDSLKQQYERVLLSCTSPQQAALADRVVLVIEAGATPRDAIDQTRRALLAAGVHLAGCVLNHK